MDRIDTAEISKIRLLRAVRNLAVKEGLDPDKLVFMTDRLSCRCAVCWQPFTTPKIYYGFAADGRQVPRGILCAYCDAAIKRCGGTTDLARLKRHERFLVPPCPPGSAPKREGTQAARRRQRLANIIDLDLLKGPFDEPANGEP
jgi:hypothetical protein